MEIDYDSVRDHVLNLLFERGITIDDIAEITYTVQKDYYDNLTMEDCLDCVNEVFRKPEALNTVLTAVILDVSAEKGIIAGPLRTLILNNHPLYGIDEVLAYSLVNGYGSIGLTNYGYIDKKKIGILDKLSKDSKMCYTFVDDMIAGIAASAASLIAKAKIL